MLFRWCEVLIGSFRARVVGAYVAARGVVVVWEDVFEHDGFFSSGATVCSGRFGGGFPAALEVALEVAADVAGVFFDLGDEVGLVHEVELAEGYELLEAVGEEFAADVEAAYCLVDGPAAQDGCDGCMGVAGVDDEEGFCWYVG